MSTGFWTMDRIATALEPHATGSAPRGPASVNGITTDTRKIAKGDVFVALKGERFDGHDYLRDAVRDGASALVVSRAPKLNSLGVPLYEVRNTLVALGAQETLQQTLAVDFQEVLRTPRWSAMLLSGTIER